MKFTREAVIIPQGKENKVILHVDRDISDIFKDITLDTEYDLTVKKRRNKRSLDANAYSWVLISKLAEKLNKKPIEVYQELIRDMFTYEIVPIRVDAIDHWIMTWETRGLGWLSIDIGPTKNFPEYHNVKCHYGSSVFDTKEMSQFIDMIIQECKEQGIEHLSPDEIRRLKEAW